MKRLLWLFMFIVSYEECGIATDFYNACRCISQVATFDSENATKNFLAMHAEAKVYEGRPIEFQVNIKTEQRKREQVDTVEVGRDVIFK